MVETKFKTPVLFLIFNRPVETEKVFREIRKAKPKKLFIASDGPREGKKGEKEIVEKTRETVLNMIDWDCDVQTLFREKNLGCKYAVSGAIDWFFENVEEGIILEDDCLPKQSFFPYCQELLERFRDDKRIMSISGDCYFDNQKNDKFSYYFFNIPLIWGWATWKRAWDLYDVEMDKYKEFLEEKTINDVFLDRLSENYFQTIFNETYNKKIDTWDYQWVYACLINSGLTCIPSRNLISNIGFSQEATHTKIKPKNKEYMFLHEDLDFPLKHPYFVLKNKNIESYILKNHFGVNIKNFIKKSVFDILKTCKRKTWSRFAL